MMENKEKHCESSHRREREKVRNYEDFLPMMTFLRATIIMKIIINLPLENIG